MTEQTLGTTTITQVGIIVGCGINFRRLPALKPLMMPPLMLLSLCSTFFPKIYYTPFGEFFIDND